MGGIAFTSPLDFQTNLTRGRGSLTLSRSYEDTHIDANSLVRDNRERLRFRADTFEYSSLRVQNKITGSGAIRHCVDRDQRWCE
jgi:hypothetical protein